MAAKMLEVHRSNGVRLCYAHSHDVVTLQHTFSNSIRPVTLRCTRPLGHTDTDPTGGTGDGSMHRDGNCCWRAHHFPEEMATGPEPEWRQTERCVRCQQAWPCDVAVMAEAINQGADRPS